MSRTPRIGILTGGGDVPGLNAVIRASSIAQPSLATRSTASGEAGKGLTHMKPGPGLDTDYIVRSIGSTPVRSIEPAAPGFTPPGPTPAR